MGDPPSRAAHKGNSRPWVGQHIIPSHPSRTNPTHELTPNPQQRLSIYICIFTPPGATTDRCCHKSWSYGVAHSGVDWLVACGECRMLSNPDHCACITHRYMRTPNQCFSPKIRALFEEFATGLAFAHIQTQLAGLLADCFCFCFWFPTLGHRDSDQAIRSQPRRHHNQLHRHSQRRSRSLSLALLAVIRAENHSKP